MQITTGELPEAITEILFAGLVPYIVASPGAGKSDIVEQVADNLNLKMIDVRLSTKDPVEIFGFPSIQNGKTSCVPPIEFPLTTDKILEGYDGWLIFLDEINHASPATIAAAYQLILDRKVGQYDLHKNVAIVAAGNRATDKAITNRMSTAMQSRLVHIDLLSPLNDWLEWAFKKKIDPRITSFLEFRPELFNNFNPDHKDLTYSCARTWEFAHKLIKDKATISLLTLKILTGTIGEGAAREFKGFTDICESLPKFKDILANPNNIAIKQSPDVLYAFTSLISSSVTKDNIKPLMEFTNRLPLEFQIVTWVNSIKRNQEIFKLPEIKEWVSKHAKDIVL